VRHEKGDATSRRAAAARLRFLRRASDPRRPRLRRGVSLLPSLFTMGNLFCGYACVVYAMRGEFETGAMFIGIAIVLDMLDGRIARLTGTSTDFGLQFDSLADVISFGMAPAILSFQWGLSPLGRLGWAAGFFFVAAAALRLSRFNIQSAGGDKRSFVGMPSPPAAGIPAATVYPSGGWHHAHCHASEDRAPRDGLLLPRVGFYRNGHRSSSTPRRSVGKQRGFACRQAGPVRPGGVKSMLRPS
jgi:CDP-diacylglycerol--serine O-phosphatidyltransferase